MEPLPPNENGRYKLNGGFPVKLCNGCDTIIKTFNTMDFNEKLVASGQLPNNPNTYELCLNCKKTTNPD